MTWAAAANHKCWYSIHVKSGHQQRAAWRLRLVSLPGAVRRTCWLMVSVLPAMRRSACIEKLVLLGVQLLAMERIWQSQNVTRWPGQPCGAVWDRAGD